MVKALINRLALALIVVAGPNTATAAPPTQPARVARTWTIEDILTIPQVEQIALSRDGRSAAYLVRVTRSQDDGPVFELHVLDLQSRRDVILARSDWMEHLEAMPAGPGWSVLADFGAGVQLYRVSGNTPPSTLVLNPRPVLVGNVDGGEFGVTFTRPLRFGVAFYSWSPDGRRLFYSTLEASSAPPTIVTNEPIARASLHHRTGPPVSVHFFMKQQQLASVPVMTVSDHDRVARWLGAMPVWRADAIEYARQIDTRSDPTVQRFAWDFATRQSTPLPAAAGLARPAVIGPHGGTLAIDRLDNVLRLREHQPDGRVYDYGASEDTLSDPRSPGSWRASDGAFSLTAVRIPREARYALLKIDEAGHRQLIDARGSLRNCAFDSALHRGICIHEALDRPPQLASVDARSARVTDLHAVSARYETIAPLRITPRTWTNAYGFVSAGFVIYPRGYQPTKRYPAIIVTHGSDADQRFGAPSFQWNYPVQVLAERGYVVVLLNDPFTAQSPTIEMAATTENSCDGKTSPAEVRRLLWLDTVESMRSAITELDRDGVIDPARVGVAGYSFGSQIVNVAITQTHLFRAASSGDGGFLEPSVYLAATCSYNAIYGGAPGDPAAAGAYQAFAPSYRASYTHTPVLQQLAEPLAIPTTDFYRALRAHGVPAEMTLYPGESEASDETHIFHIPANRHAAMQENLEWFDFWLRGIEPSSGPDGQRRQRWDALRDKALRDETGPMSP